MWIEWTQAVIAYSNNSKKRGIASSSMEPAPVVSDDWCLVGRDGHRYRLPKTMLFMGREECDIVVKSQTVDKRHAVITFDHYLDSFKIKDLSTVNGTFVNDVRIHDQEYVPLEHMDSLRLGYDSMVYRIERIKNMDTPSQQNMDQPEAAVPVPAWVTKELPHMAECKGCIAEQRIEHTCGNHDLDSVISQREHLEHAPPPPMETDPCPTGDDGGQKLETVKKGTPLYGQPDWWGDDDAPTGDNSEMKNEKKSEVESHNIQNQDTDSQKSPPADLSMASSVSKDSLLSQQMTAASPSSPKHKDLSGPTQDSDLTQTVTKRPDGNTSMAFTVDFGDDESNKKVSGKKLSEFVPSKIRKSFDDRKEKTSSKMSSGSSGKDGLPEKEKESSLSSSRQRKIDDSDSQTSKRRGSDAGKKVVKPVSKERDDSAVKTTGHRRTLSASSSGKAKLSLQKDKTQSDKPTNVTDSASYLIDKMFETNTKSSPAKGRRTPRKTVADKFTEHAMYKEARQYEQRKPGTPSGAKDSSIKEGVHTRTKRPGSGILKKEVSKTQPTVVKQEAKPQENAEVEIVEEAKDDGSDAGTYTIDADKECKEEEQARENIEQVFGVRNNAEDILADRADTDRSEVHDSGMIPGKEELIITEDISITKEDLVLQDFEDQMTELERKRSQQPETDSMDVDVGSAVMEELKIVEEEENPQEALPSDAPTWVTQWAALTNQQKNKKMEAPSPESQRSSFSDKDMGVSPDGKKPSRGGINRKRPGTGRRLPSLPSDKSPSGSQCSSRLSQSTDSQSPRCPSTPRYGENNNLDTSKSKVVTISSRVVNRFDDTDTETITKTKFTDSDTDSVAKSLLSGDQTPKSSVSTKSAASVDTEILLKDTETVMAAMEARMESKHETYNGVVTNGDGLNTDRRFSDSESMIAMVNGDDDFEKPTQYESPRQNLARTKGVRQHKPLSRVSSASARLQAFREKNYKRNSWTDSSVVSDVMSENTIEQLDLDTSTDRSELTLEGSESGANFNRSGSKGKGQISMSRPNRAFQLRRLKADGGEHPDSPGSGITSATSLTNVSESTKSYSSTGSATPTRLNKSMNRLSYPTTKQDSARSNNSLGTTIVQRSRQGQVSDRTESNRSEASLGDRIANQAKRNSGNFMRSDGGRYSLKLNRSLSTQDSINGTSDSSYTSSPTRKPDFKAIKSRLKTTPSYGLSVTGMSSRSSSSSQPASRSNSPKSAEKQAWKRRKEYDPRKAVAEAKAKAKECKVKVDSSSRIYGRMTRSASFTNTKELQRYHKDVSNKSDCSSVEDTSLASEITDTHDNSFSQRGFVPYSGRSQSSRLFSGSEEEDVGVMVKSAHDLSRCVVGTLRYKSAFTPPPPKINPSPRSSPSSLPLSVFKKRSPHENSKIPTSSSKSKKTVPSSSAQKDQVCLQSYDGILVSSIYQLSQKMKSNTDKTLQKLKENRIVENGISSPSPIDDILNHSSNSDMPGWKLANQELANILKNLRKLDHHFQVMHKALFPDDDSCSDSPGLSGREKHEYLQEIERIRGELAGFQPITTPDDPWKRSQDQESVESDCEELGVGEEFF